MVTKKEMVVDQAEALIEMYKAGFLDGYSVNKKMNNSTAFKVLNKFYKIAFIKRFEKKVNKEMKKNAPVSIR